MYVGWKFMYAMHLAKINAVGYNIAKNQYFYIKYLKGTCNGEKNHIRTPTPILYDLIQIQRLFSLLYLRFTNI